MRSSSYTSITLPQVAGCLSFPQAKVQKSFVLHRVSLCLLVFLPQLCLPIASYHLVPMSGGILILAISPQNMINSLMVTWSPGTSVNIECSNWKCMEVVFRTCSHDSSKHVSRAENIAYGKRMDQ